MRWRWPALLLAVLFGIALQAELSGADRLATHAGCAAGSSAQREGAAPPQKACAVLAEIQRRNGEAPPGHVGARAFQNRERHLPRGSYREYDVDAKVPGRSRGAERIVIEQRTGKAYYTRDHYETFIPMN